LAAGAAMRRPRISWSTDRALRRKRAAAPIAGPTKHCRECYSLMPAKANKCIACGSAQNWQRFVAEGTSVFALLVALVSVLTFAAPIWKHEFYTPRPRPSVRVVGFAQGDPADGLAVPSIKVLISNGGDAPMFISSASINIGGYKYFIQPDSKSAFQSIVEPNAIYDYLYNVNAGSIAMHNDDMKLEREPFHSENLDPHSEHDRVVNSCTIDITLLPPSGKAILGRESSFDSDVCSSIVQDIMVDADIAKGIFPPMGQDITTSPPAPSAHSASSAHRTSSH